jgi:hypothetical protein
MLLSSALSFLASKAINIAERVLQQTVENAFDSPPQQPSGVLDDVLARSVEQLKETGAASRDAIIGKIEADKLEQLQSRIQNLGFVIRVGKVNDALTYILTVKESVDYAENRLREGKTEWLSATIVGRATVVAALSHLRLETAAEASALKKICVQARHQMLDQLVANRVRSSQPLPWEQIHAFLDNSVDGAALFGESFPSLASSATIPKEWLEVRMQLVNGDCKICDVLVRSGQQVRAGEALLTAETDKSSIDLRCPHSGLVRSISVKPGDRVAADGLVAYIEPMTQLKS